jgi:hypothetical protein
LLSKLAGAAVFLPAFLVSLLQNYFVGPSVSAPSHNTTLAQHYSCTTPLWYCVLHHPPPTINIIPHRLSSPIIIANHQSSSIIILCTVYQPSSTTHYVPSAKSCPPPTSSLRVCIPGISSRRTLSSLEHEPHHHHYTADQPTTRRHSLPTTAAAPPSPPPPLTPTPTTPSTMAMLTLLMHLQLPRTRQPGCHRQGRPPLYRGRCQFPHHPAIRAHPLTPHRRACPVGSVPLAPAAPAAAWSSGRCLATVPAVGKVGCGGPLRGG